MYERSALSVGIRRRVEQYELLAIISSLWFMVQFLRYAFPPLFGTFQAEFGVSNTETGVLFTLMMLAYSMMQFPAGVVSDRIGRVRTITIGAAVFTVGALATVLVTEFIHLLLVVIVIGAGTGAHKTVSINLLSNRYPENTGLSLGVFDTVGQFGGVVAPALMVAVLSAAVEWSAVFLLAGFVSGAFGLLHWTRIEDVAPTENGSDLSAGFGQYLDVFADTRFLAFVIVTILFTFSWNGVVAFLPLYLTNKGLSTSLAGLLYSGFFVVSTSQLLTGRLSDRFGQLHVALAVFVVMIAALSLLVVSTGTLVVIGLTLLTGAAFHGFRPVRDSYLMMSIPDAIGGGTLGVVRTFMTLIGAVAPAVIGFLSDAVGFTAAFGTVVVALTGATVLVFGLLLTAN